MVVVLDPVPERGSPGAPIASTPDAPPSWLGNDRDGGAGRRCAFCGELAPPASSFCPNCGRALTAALMPPHGGALSVVFTDIEDSTQLNERMGDATWEAIIDQHNDIVREEIHRQRGFEVKLTGDGFLIVFPDAVDAIRCAARIQARVTLRAAHHGPAWPVRVRVGIHLGDVILRPGGDILGRTVNMASRIVAKSGGGVILSSTAFVEELDPHVSRDFWIDIGARRLRGMPRREHLYRFSWADYLRAQASVEDPGPQTMRFNDNESFDPFDPALEAVQ